MAQQFGGDWTQEKLKRVRKYLKAYATIMKRQPFRFAYIDAFAGTGFRELVETSEEETPLFPKLNEEEAQRFIEGSAREALKVKPSFDRYVFIEADPDAFDQLEQLKQDFPDKKDQMSFHNEDANDWLIRHCNRGTKELDDFWRSNRAVVFLDPFGMQVGWQTIEAIASTKAIDLWILFPLGVAVNRLLKKDGQIRESWQAKLTAIFGTSRWYDVFYEEKTDLFGEATVEKTTSLERIGQYYNERLASVFAEVADNPLPLRNSTGNPLYLLCFAAANPKGAPTAIRIAQDILSRN
jgi:three-Cys-motif partner protein